MSVVDLRQQRELNALLTNLQEFLPYHVSVHSLLDIWKSQWIRKPSTLPFRCFSIVELSFLHVVLQTLSSLVLLEPRCRQNSIPRDLCRGLSRMNRVDRFFLAMFCVKYLIDVIDEQTSSYTPNRAQYDYLQQKSEILLREKRNRSRRLSRRAFQRFACVQFHLLLFLMDVHRSLDGSCKWFKQPLWINTDWKILFYVNRTLQRPLCYTQDFMHVL